MAEHRSTQRSRFARLSSVRIRAVLALGVVLGIGTVGTFAFWTENAVVDAGTLSSGTLHVQVNGANPYTSLTLPMTAMVPGSTSAEVLTVSNTGTAPLKYTFTGGLGGTNAADFSSAGAAGLLLTIRQGGTKTGGTCTGGSVVFTEAPLTNVTTTVLLARRPTTPLSAANNLGVGGGTEALCVQIKLSDTAPTTLQGKTATATFSVNATSDVS